MNLNGQTRFIDWPNRYYHVDQVLERPGPRTDDSFAAGDAVSTPRPTRPRVARAA